METGEKGAIAEQDIELQKLLLGLDEVNSGQEFHTQVYEDAIRNFAQSVGDDNPLYCDPDYACKTRWLCSIAPQIMTAIINSPLRGKRIPRDIKKKTRGLFKGCQTFVSGGTWNWYRPIAAGDRIYSFEGEESMEIKDSKFGGTTVHLVHRYVKFNQRGEVVGVYRMLRILSERSSARKKGKYKEIELGEYDERAIQSIDTNYLKEAPRGAVPRLWEGVSEGDPMKTLLKGPLTVTDIILAHCAGYGLAPYRMLATSRVAAKDRARMPRMYFNNERGVPDTGARVHWDTVAAKGVGNPEAYDWGLLREFWLYHAISDWMGDDAFVVRMKDEIRKFNYLGDLQTISGTVTKKYQQDGMSLVDVEVSAVNQRKEVTAIAEATVSLPTEDRACVLPSTPEDLQHKAVEFLAEHERILAEAQG